MRTTLIQTGIGGSLFSPFCYEWYRETSIRLLILAKSNGIPFRLASWAGQQRRSDRKTRKKDDGSVGFATALRGRWVALGAADVEGRLVTHGRVSSTRIGSVGCKCTMADVGFSSSRQL